MLTKTEAMGYELAGKGQHLTSAMKACASWAAVEEHDKVLDMACGNGALLNHMNSKMRLTLCGMCDSADQARAVSEQLGGADVIAARMEDIPWRDDTFDVILLSASLRGEARRVLSEVNRALRPGGQFVMASSVFSRYCVGETNRREIMRLMQEAGFREVSFRITGLCGAIVGWKKGKLDQ